MKPTIGRIVTYNLRKNEQDSMNVFSCNNQKQVPAIIVAVWGETCVNLKVLLDGPQDLWRTSVMLGNDDGQWNWPQIEK